eukprot:CAMPEP_0117594320 /NCGR_PEP_ID=MMETSP0784-20121206/73137_1 /TAXON_ID=39447 /ORGANISM="" /LENGTH=299 /DNA_ID=CAMNT_0005396369 /DNA_START=462 /DNA_END=1362 /DNA_ORIENTATION=-
MCRNASGGRARQGAAKPKASPFEIEAEANVERHVSIVSVHVQPQVLPVPVADDEAVVSVPHAPRSRPKHGTERLQGNLEAVDQGLEADFIEDDAIIVHAVRSPRGQAAGVEIEDLIDEHLAKVFSEYRERKNLAREVLREDVTPRFRRVCMAGPPEIGVEPFLLPRWWDCEELGMPCDLRILLDNLEALSVLLPIRGKDRLHRLSYRLLAVQFPRGQRVDQEVVDCPQRQTKSAAFAFVPRKRVVEWRHHAPRPRQPDLSPIFQFDHDAPLIVLGQRVMEHALKPNDGQGARPCVRVEA